MGCKDICKRHAAKKPAGGIGRYEAGQKRCQTCNSWMYFEGLWCPCCGFRFRTKPRNVHYKAALAASQEGISVAAIFEDLQVNGALTP